MPAWPSASTPGNTADVLRRVLPNGLTVLVEARRTAPVVSVMMWYRVGSREEVPGATGIAHFVEHLMFKGTPSLAKGQIDRLTMQAGGSNNAFTGTDYTAYVFDLPAGGWTTALRIEADRMLHSRFVPGEFEAERQVVMEERRGGEDDPAERLHEQLNGVTFLAHPYRNPVIGWMSDIRRLTRAQVIDFYGRHYVPANATCVIVGDVDPPAAIQQVERAFAAIPRLPAPSRPRPEEPPQVGERQVTVRLEAQAPRLEVQFHTPRRGHPHQAALELVVQALAGGKSSRLYRRLVEGEQLATEVSGEVGDGLDPDATRFAMTLKPGVSPERAEVALLDELVKISQAPLPAEELNKARNQLETEFVEEQDTAHERANALGEAASLTGIAYLDQYLPRLAAVTPDQAQRVAALYFRDTNRNVGWLVPTVARGQAAHPTSTGAEGAAGHEAIRLVSRGLNPPSRTYKPPLRGAPTGSSPLQRGLYTVAGGFQPPARRRYRLVGRSRRNSVLARSSRRPIAPKTPPAPAFRPLPVVRRVLPNGLTVLLLENHTSPLFTAAALVRAGSRDEPEAKAGLAHLTAELLDGGTEHQSNLEIAQKLESLGVDFEATAGGSVTTVKVGGLSRAMRPALEVWADALRHPTFPEDQTAAERERTLADIHSTADDPGQVASHAFRDLVYGAHSEHRPVEGYERTVTALTRDDLAAFHREHYLPNQTTIALVGDFHAPEAMQLVERLLSDWQRGMTPAAVEPAVTRQTERRERRVVLPKEQMQVILGHLGVTRRNPDYVALEVLDMILGTGAGGTFTARIPQQLRDVQGLAYTVGASITATAGDDPGVFAASMGTQPKNTARAIDGLLREIRRIRREPVTSQELADAVHYLTGSYVFEFETNEQLAAYLLEVEHFHLGIDYRMRYPALVRAVTAGDLLRVARRYLDPDHYSLVVVGPAAAARVSTTKTQRTPRKPAD